MILFIDSDRALEATMNGIPAQQTGTAVQVENRVLRWPENHRLSHQILTTTNFLNQQPGRQSADTTKPIDHNVHRLVSNGVGSANDMGTFASDIGLS